MVNYFINIESNTEICTALTYYKPSGGISIKPAANMDKMKGDMGGAAVTIGTLYAISKLNLPLNAIGIIPLCENMPSGSAVKPGDVLTAMSGKTIEVDNSVSHQIKMFPNHIQL